ncbi:hypothetical protein BD769DRAFT_1413561, partial [Suillus cothurnatus]
MQPSSTVHKFVQILLLSPMLTKVNLFEFFTRSSSVVYTSHRVVLAITFGLPCNPLPLFLARSSFPNRMESY